MNKQIVYITFQSFNYFVHDNNVLDVVTWTHFSCPFVRGIHRSTWFLSESVSNAELWYLFVVVVVVVVVFVFGQWLDRFDEQIT